MEFPTSGEETPQSNFRLPNWDLLDITNNFHEKPGGERPESQERFDDPEREFQQAFENRGAVEINNNKWVLVEPKVAAEHREYLADARRQIAEKFPSEIKGLNLDWTEDYVKDLGLHATDLVVLPEEAKTEWDAEMARLGQHSPVSTGDHIRGRIYPPLDLGVVFREFAQEEVCGSEFTERIGLHERLHGTGMRGDIIIEGTTGKIDMHASFFRDESHCLGRFLEEGFAEMHSNSASMERGYDGVWDPNSDILTVDSYDEDVRVYLPTGYVHKAPNGEPNFIYPAYPAAALEALIEVDPEINTALIESRKDPTKTAEVINRINAIDPKMIENLSYDSPARSLHYVLKRLGKI